MRALLLLLVFPLGCSPAVPSATPPSASSTTQEGPSAVPPDASSGCGDVDTQYAQIAALLAQRKLSEASDELSRVEALCPESWTVHHATPEALFKAALAAREAKRDTAARRLGLRALIELERKHGKPAVVELPNGFNSVTGIRTSPDGPWMTVIDGNVVKVINLTTKRPLRSLEGHSKQIKEALFSPDGKVFLTCSEDKTVRLWAPSTGELLASFSDLQPNCSVAFSPDGKTLAALAWNGTARLVDLATEKTFLTISHNQELASGTGFSPDGKALWVSASDGGVVLLDITTGKRIRAVIGKAGDASYAVASPNGNFIAIGGFERGLALWDTATGKPVLAERGYTTKPAEVAFSQDGKSFAAITERSVKVWDIATKTSLYQEPWTPGVNPTSVAFSPDGKTLYVGSERREIREIELATKKLIHRYQGHSLSAEHMVFSPDKKFIVLGDKDGGVALWSLAGETPLRKLRLHQKQVSSLAFSLDGKTLFSAAWDGLMQPWDVASGKASGEPIKVSVIRDTLASPTENRLVAAGQVMGGLNLWEVPSMGSLNTLNGPSDSVTHVVASPSGSTLAASSLDRSIWVWETRSWKLLQTLRGHTSDIDTLAYSPDGKTLASGSREGVIKVWDVESGKSLHHLSGGKWIQSVSFSPDGEALAALDSLSGVRIWGLKTKKILHELTAKVSGNVTFSPDGKTISAGSNDEKVLIWDAASGKVLHSLGGHVGGVSRVAYSADGRHLFSMDSKVLRMWSVSSGALLATLAVLREGDAGYVLSAEGQVEFLGEKPQLARDFAVCRIGERTYPLWLCGEFLETSGLLSKLAAGAPKTTP